MIERFPPGVEPEPCFSRSFHLGSATRARGQFEVSRGDLQLKVGDIEEEMREDRDRALLLDRPLKQIEFVQ